MKLGYLCHPGIFAAGGPGGRTADLLAAFAHLGHEVHVRTHTLPEHVRAIRHTPDAEGLVSMTRAIDVCLVRLDGSCHAERLAEEARTARPLLPIVLEVHAPLEEQLTYPAADTAEHRARQEWIVRGNAIRRRLAAAGASAVCVSQGMVEYARQALGITNTLLSPNAADPARFGPSDPPSGAFTALWTGSTRYIWQAADLVIDAARLAPEIRFLLVSAQNQGLPEALPPNMQTVFAAPPSAMATYYARCHVALVLYHALPGSAWGFYLSPLKLYEAMAAGRAIVGSDLGEIAQVIRASGCGLIVPDSPDALACALRRLAADLPGTAEMGRRARRHAQACTWHEAAQDVATFCQQACAARGALTTSPTT